MTPGEQAVDDVSRLTEQGRRQTDRARQATDAAHETVSHADLLAAMVDKTLNTPRDT